MGMARRADHVAVARPAVSGEPRCLPLASRRSVRPRASAGRSPRSRRSSGRPRTGRGPTRGSPRGPAPRRAATLNASCVDVVAEEAVDALADDLGQAADAAGDDRRAAGERLDRDQPERLRPRAGHQRRVRLGERARRGRPAAARRGTRPTTRPPRAPAGRRSRSSRARRASGPPLAAIRSGRPLVAAISIASTIPFSGCHPADEAERHPPGAARTAHPTASGRCGRPAQSSSGWSTAWFSLIATSGGRRRREHRAAHGRSSRPWNVDTTGNGRRPGKDTLAHSRWLWMMSNSVAWSRTSSIVRRMNPDGSPPKPVGRRASGTVATRVARDLRVADWRRS